MSFDLSIIIPAYNERERIGPTISGIDDLLARNNLRYEIVVVDDGSADGTADYVRALAIVRRSVRVIECRPNRGKGSAVRVGMLASRGAVRLMMDADGSVPAREIPALVEPVRRGEADVAIGSRYVLRGSVTRKQPWYRVLWSRLGNAVVQRTILPGVVDTQCGFKAFSARAADEVFRRTRIDGWAFDLEALALARRRGFAIKEIPVRWADDPRSKISPVRDALANIHELWTIRRNLRRGVYDHHVFPLQPAKQS